MESYCEAVYEVKKPIFYVGLEGSGTDKKLGYVENAFISASSLWNGNSFRLPKLPKHERLFLDSGGFSFFNKYSEYPYNPKKYIDFVKNSILTTLLQWIYPVRRM